METAKVAEHYKGNGLMARLANALAAAGLDKGKLSIEQLAPLDQFHSRGLEATIELGKVLNPEPQTTILDIGSGLGGPSRYLAATYGSHVEGIDLSETFVEAATFLADRVGLSEKVRYQQGDALALPFDDGKFDVVWTQHVAMNISDRTQLYSEAYRVLRPGGRIAIYDVLAGEGGPLIYPVPWSKSAATSFLLTPAGMKSELEGQKFQIVSWIDRTDAALNWFSALQRTQAASPDPAPVGLHLAMGPEFKHMTGNLARNLDEGRAILIEAVAAKAA